MPSLGSVRTEREKSEQRVQALLFPRALPLPHESQRLQCVQSLAERLTLLGQRNLLLHSTPSPEELTNFIKCTTKASCRREPSKATHGIISLFDTLVILFQTIVELPIRPMDHLSSHRFAYCTRGGTMPVCRHLLRSMANDSKSLLEKLLCGIHVSLLAQPRIHRVAIAINGSREIVLLPMNLDGCLAG